MKRILVHIPFGLLLVFSARVHWTIPLVATASFLYYEKDQDHWKNDQAWRDVAGALYGIALGVVIEIAIRLFGIT